MTSWSLAPIGHLVFFEVMPLPVTAARRTLLADVTGDRRHCWHTSTLDGGVHGSFDIEKTLLRQS